jgi:hypothetical protein
MNFPDQFLMRIVDARTRAPVPRLAMHIILVARKKNNYTIPAVTNASGNVSLSKEGVRESIEEDWKISPMDYESGLEDCAPELEIHICSSEDVQRSVAAMKLFGPTLTISTELMRAFEESINDRFSPTMKRINVEEMNPSELEVEPK